MNVHLREAIALAIFRAEEEDPSAEFDTDEQWEKRISIFDSQPNPREDYLRYADAVLAITEADKAEAVAHERRRVAAEAHRALVSPWSGDPGAGPRYVMATCLREFDRLMQMLPAAQPAREAWRR